MLLDFDGVVLESVNCRDLAFHQLFDDYPADIRDEVLLFHQSHPGIDRREKIERIFTEVLKVIPSPEDIEQKVAKFGNIAYQLVIQCPVVSGLNTFLDLISPRPVYIISAARETEVRRIASERNIAKRFNDILGSPRKKTDLISHVLMHEKISPETAIFIGDKISDYNSAQSTNVPFIGRVPAKSENPFPESVETIENFTYFTSN